MSGSGFHPTKMPPDPRVQQALETIVGWRDTDVPKLPENLFLSHIMPILLDKSGKVDVSNWLDVAGTLGRAIDVVDGAGNVLFRVPPLQRQLKTKTHRDNRPSINRIVTHTELKRRQSPVVADKFLAAELQKVDVRNELDVEPLIALNAIFKRYNYPEIPLGREAQVEHDAAERGSGFSGDYDDI